MRNDFGGGGADLGVNCGTSFFWLIWFGFLIYYLIVMYQTLNKISPKNRDMEPGMVFLSLIPCFGLIWNFFVVNAVASSLEKEFRKRGLSGDGDFGKQVGLIGNILNCTLCCSIGWIVCAIIQLLKVMEFSKKLDKPTRRSRDDDYDDDDDDDDRPRKRRPRDDDDDDEDADDRPRRKRRRDDDDDD